MYSIYYFNIFFVSSNVRFCNEQVNPDNLKTNAVAAFLLKSQTARNKSESQYSSQSSEQVDYGTPPDTRVQSFEDYDWEQDRMIKYYMNDKGDI